MIYIIIPVHNRLHLTLACLQSLQSQTYRDFKIIVVDDGSTDGSFAYIETHFKEVIVVWGNGQLWWTGAINAGVKKALSLSYSASDYILTLNNDLVVRPDYLNSLLSVAREKPNALVGSISVNIHLPEQIHFSGTQWNSKTAKYKPSLKEPLTYSILKSMQSTVATDLLPGRGILIPITAFTRVGLYDGKNFPHYMADEDFSLRAKEAGYQLLISTKAAVLNYIDATGLDYTKKNWQYYKDVLTSTKSPSNIRNRWRWAWRHATIFPPVYFVVDMLRILKHLLLSR